MQRDELVQLGLKPGTVSDPLAYILRAASGLRVLNVGASGGVEHYLPLRSDLWLHAMLGGVARDLVGIDIDAESIEYARRHGINIVQGDCELIRFDQSFDLIVMADVIEHVNSPVRAIENLASQLTSSGCLIITTPNPTHFGLVLKAWLGRNVSVYYDHVTGFLPEHLKAISNRLNLQMTEVAFFTWIDSRSASNRLKSFLGRAIGNIFTRSHSTFLVVVQRNVVSD